MRKYSATRRYLPDDSTGDWLYQALEIATLVLVAREYLVWQDFPEQSAPVTLLRFFRRAIACTAKPKRQKSRAALCLCPASVSVSTHVFERAFKTLPRG